jgi:hypothetical protein
VRSKLAKDLAGALRLALDTMPAPPPEAVHWQPHFQNDPDLWFDRAEPQLVTNPAHGTSKFVWKDRFPGYARLIPSKWAAKPGARQAIANHPGHPTLLARANSLSYGISRGGALIYWPGTEEDGVHPTLAITQWFEKTGEFWGVGGGFLFEREGRVRLATGYFFHHWLEFLKRNTSLALAHGGSLPIHVRLGVGRLAGSWWPEGRYSFGDEGYAAVEESYEFQATLTSVSPEALQEVAVDAFNGLAVVYGVEAHSYDQIVALSK